MSLNKMEHLDADARACVQNCQEAVQSAEWCADACAGLGAEMETCIRLCRDVADLASLHARFLVRDSAYKAGLGQICADACNECADECERFDHDHCQTCATVLRECARSCENLSA